LLALITKFLGSLYNNILIYIIIFLLFIIAFGTIFVKIPLELLLNYLYLPEFLQNIIGVFQNNEIVNTTGIVAKVNTDSLEATIKNMLSMQNSMLSLLDKQNETMLSLQK